VKEIQEQKEWIKSGGIGCLFATALLNRANEIGWVFQIEPKRLEIPKDCFVLSILFPNSNAEKVRLWALDNGFYIEDINEMYEGLRINLSEGISWVQYFGKDSHVKTRQSPHPMLSFTCKMPPQTYFKVGFNGVLHLAHASIKHLTKLAADKMWENSHKKTEKILGHKPTIREAAKTTFIK